jgi:hypothetical protein
VFSAVNGLEFDTDHVRGLTDRLKRYGNGDRRLVTNSRSEAAQAAASRTYRSPISVTKTEGVDDMPFDADDEGPLEGHIAAEAGASDWARNPEQTFNQQPMPTESAIVAAAKKRAAAKQAEAQAQAAETGNVKLPARKSVQE